MKASIYVWPHRLTVLLAKVNTEITRDSVLCYEHHTCLSLSTQQKLIMEIPNETTSDPAKAIISSASIPGVFPHRVWPKLGPNGEDVVCMDGGAVGNTNLVSAIERCREQVDDDSEIILDVIRCQGSEAPSW